MLRNAALHQKSFLHQNYKRLLELAKVLCHNICVLCQAIHELGIEPAFYDAD